MKNSANRQRNLALIISAYPLVIMLVSIAINWFAFGVNPATVQMPQTALFHAMAIACTLLILNHAWLMTVTELTRLRYKISATPEEWKQSGNSPEDVDEKGWLELKRCHNAHRNTTENTIYFVFVALVSAFLDPALLAAQFWMIGFAVARLGYSFCYLRAATGGRGLFMPLSLLSLFGLASQLILGLVIS